MYAREFSDTFLQKTLEKLSFENRDIILMNKFNIDILKYDTNNNSTSFLDMMYGNFLLPYISSPIRVTPRSQTLIDNIFKHHGGWSNVRKHYNHHFRALCTVYTLQKQNKITKIKKNAKFARNFKALDKEMFDSDLKNMNRKEILKIERGYVDYSFKIFNKKLNEILDKHAPFKELSIQEEKLSKKPWLLLEYLIQLKIKIGCIERS